MVDSAVYLFVVAFVLATFVIAVVGVIMGSILMINGAGTDDGSNADGAIGSSRAASFYKTAKYDTVSTSWTQWGRGIKNSRHMADPYINSATVGKLKVKWSYPLNGGSLLAHPSAHNGYLYFCEPSSGLLTSINAKTGAKAWSVQVAAITGVDNDYCRGGPSVDPDSGLVVAGSRMSGRLFAVRVSDGVKAWTSEVESHVTAQMTQPATIYAGTAYVGVASSEEKAASDPSYECCSFRGSVVAVRVADGTLLWKTYTLPAGYVGAGVWGPAPSIDIQRGQVYVATGNLYLNPAGLTECHARMDALGAHFDQDPCLPVEAHAGSVLALDMITGNPLWSRRISSNDAWNTACGVSTPILTMPALSFNCPTDSGLESDFAQGPMIVELEKGRDVLLVGQKSGVVWKINPDNGYVMQASVLGPGGVAGGIQWSGANNGTHAFFPVTNSASVSQTLKNLSVPGVVATTGSTYTAVNIKSGDIVWQYPLESWLYAYQPLTVANDVLFATAVTRMSPANGTSSIKALHTSTGEKLWEDTNRFHIAGTGALVVDGMVYVGVTTSNPVTTTNTHSIVAFGLLP
jgi:polyvinyl alcohol dehydrogenase (cytochrome)